MSNPVTDGLATFLQHMVDRNPRLEELRGERGAPLKLTDASQYFEARRFEPGEVIVSQDAEKRAVYLIVRGEARVYEQPRSEEGATGSAQLVNTLREGDTVGEVGMVMRWPRTATVTAATEMEVLVTGHKRLGLLSREDPVLGVALLRWFAENVVLKIRSTSWFDENIPVGAPLVPSPGATLGGGDLGDGDAAESREAIRNRLVAMECFRWRQGQITDGVTDAFSLKRVEAGRTILADGRDGDSLLLLSRGTASVRDKHGTPVMGFAAGHPECIHVLLGEMAYLHPGPRTGNVIAESDCELLETSCGLVPALIQASPGFAVMLHLRILRAICRKLAATTALAAHYQAVLGGDWKQWFVAEDHYMRSFSGP